MKAIIKTNESLDRLDQIIKSHSGKFSESELQVWNDTVANLKSAVANLERGKSKSTFSGKELVEPSSRILTVYMKEQIMELILFVLQNL